MSAHDHGLCRDPCGHDRGPGRGDLRLCPGGDHGLGLGHDRDRFCLGRDHGRGLCRDY